jgi:hypothetical protein
MHKFKKDRLVLLQTLRDLVKEEISNSSINDVLEYEVAEFIAEVKDRRRTRRLKQILKEVDKWIDDVDAERKIERAVIREQNTNEPKHTIEDK